LNDLSDILRAETAAHGPVSFARFMELALYHPQHGYYEGPERRIGREGDFITSVAVGSLFGELLAAQFNRWLGELQTPNFQLPTLLEAGAHDGRLANDILHAWPAQPAKKPGIRHLLLEPSERRRAWQRETLATHRHQVEWRDGWAALGGPVHGVIFANELLDAFPVHRLGWSAVESRWFEWLVADDGEPLETSDNLVLSEGRAMRVPGVHMGKSGTRVTRPSGNRVSQWDRFVWRRGSGPVSPELAGLIPASLQVAGQAGVLPEGYTTEVSPGALTWWRTAAAHLGGGWLVTFDYGLLDEEYLNPARCEGTLRAYHGQRLDGNVLADPGKRDLTAHVNFTALQRTGAEAGLETAGCWTQEQFLGGIVKQLPPDKLTAWDAAKRRQFQALTHPEQLGRKFRVLVQWRAAAT
jgi:SAM-dependent MidA family methyltransferase